MAQMHLVFDYTALGRWDEVMGILEEYPLPDEASPENQFPIFINAIGHFARVHRGELQEAERSRAAAEAIEDPADVQGRLHQHFSTAVIRLAQGRSEESLAAAEVALESLGPLGLRAVAPGLTAAMEAAFDFGRMGRVEELLAIGESAAPSERNLIVRAQALRFRGRLAARAGDRPAADAGFREAEALFRTAPYPFWLAVTQLEHAESLVAFERDAEAAPLFEEARATFLELGAEPWLRRAERGHMSEAPGTVVPA